MATHAKLSPSAAESWMTCADYPNANEGLPDDESKAAFEGTIAHGYSDLCLKLGMDAYDFIGAVSRHRKSTDWVFEWSDIDADLLQPGLDWVLRESKNGVLLTEQRVDLSHILGPGQFGTADRTIIRSDLLILNDLKWGVGIPVSPVKNKQLMLYLHGVWWPIRKTWPGKEFLLVIDQPRNQAGGGEWRLTLDELVAFGEEAKKAADATRAANPKRTASEKGCYWCKRRKAEGGCATYEEWMVDHFGMMFEEIDENAIIGCTPELPEGLTAERRSYIVQHVPLLKRWLDELYRDTIRDALAGDPTPGLKAILGRKSRDKWRDPKKAEDAVQEHVGDSGFIRKTKTPKQIQTQIGKEVFALTLSDHVIIGQPKPILVSDSDDRPAIPPATMLFEDEEVEDSEV